MHRPLWQILLPILLVGAAVQRGAGAAVLALSSAPAAATLGVGLETGALLLAAAGVWFGGRTALASAAVLALSATASAGLAIAALGPLAVPGALARLILAGLGAAGLVYLGRQQRGHVVSLDQVRKVRDGASGSAASRSRRPALRAPSAGAPRARPRAHSPTPAPRAPR